MDKIQELKNLIEKSKKIIFLTGAGISTISGISDFRSKNGLYSEKELPYTPEEILSRTFFYAKYDEFWKYYKKNFDLRNFEPNIVHKKIVEMQKMGKVIGVITQNVDNLHTKAKTENLIEYHGNISKNKCCSCGKEFSADYVFDSINVPRCDVCHGKIKPEITLYEEYPYQHNEAHDLLDRADLLIVLGTSLNVYPAAFFVEKFAPFGNIVIINKEKTKKDGLATLCINEELSEVFKEL
jgi:NAD-dependent deacetylase